MEKYVSLNKLWKTLRDGTEIETHAVPFAVIFAYDSDSLDSIYDEMIALCEGAPNLRYCLDGIWVLSKGFLTWTQLDLTHTGPGDPYPLSVRTLPFSGSPSADLVQVVKTSSEVLFPLIADLNDRLIDIEGDAYMTSLLTYVRGSWGTVQRSTKFEFHAPTRVIPSTDEARRIPPLPDDLVPQDHLPNADSDSPAKDATGE